mmetsp:Transcript_36874/g.45556  ORF Transcript_36874/g.45556 Transcript_36874/m.45556 type:complete len:92 (+) Transcript_36874:27-302(+)
MGQATEKPRSFYDKKARCSSCQIHIGAGKTGSGYFVPRNKVSGHTPRYCSVCGKRFCGKCKLNKMRQRRGGYKCRTCVGTKHIYRADKPLN